MTDGVCGAKTRSGAPCKNKAMPNGRCRMHGGKSLAGVFHGNFKHGRYSKVLPTRLQESYNAAQADENLLELRSEIAVITARLEELIGRLEESDSGRLWQDTQQSMREFDRLTGQARSEPDPSKRAQLVGQANEKLVSIRAMVDKGASEWETWAQITDIMDMRRKLVQAEQRRLEAMRLMITAEDAMTLITQLAMIIKKHVTDRRILADISTDFKRIALSAARRSTEQ